MTHRLTTLLLAIALVSGPIAALATETDALVGNAEAGKGKSATCVACHGPDGNSIVPMWPKLAGQHESYLLKQLLNFKHGQRENAQMSPQVVPLSEQDLADLAAYYASQTQTPGTTEPELAEAGEKLYRAGNAATGVPACSGCHGPDGAGLASAKFPRLAGQHADYIAQTLKYFRAGERANDPNAMMRGTAARLTDDEIEALAQYIQGEIVATKLQYAQGPAQ